jgi:hypothetical protein
MPKLHDQAIEEKDITEYLALQSDFAFEVKTLSKLCELGFTCAHAGTYEDPLTGRVRQFDIRAIKDRQLSATLCFRLLLSVECKNLRPNFPLLIHCMSRRQVECMQTWIWSFPPVAYGFFNAGVNSVYARAVCPEGPLALYREGDPVGKATDQVGRRLDGELIENDADVFDKMSQAISAAHDLVRISCFASAAPLPHVVSAVIPVLVVPDDRLWMVQYDNSGNITAGPKKVGSVEFYLGKRVEITHGGFQLSCSLSHLEIVQLSEIEVLVAKLMNEAFVSVDAVKEILAAEARLANEMSIRVVGAKISPP